MAGSLSLTLYSLARRREGAAEEGTTQRPPRPAGRLAWLHVPGQSSAPTMLELARRLVDEDGISVLVTSALALPPEDGVIYQPPPAEIVGTAEAFLDHWQPEIGVFSEGELRPMLLAVAAARALPMILVDGLRPGLPEGVSRWYPGLRRGALAAFSHVTALDAHAAKAFRRAGAARVQVAGRMEERSTALPCVEAEREDLAGLLAARPVWFAVSIPESEEPAVLAAHRHVISMNHRLLLILMPRDPARAAPLAA